MKNQSFQFVCYRKSINVSIVTVFNVLNPKFVVKVPIKLDNYLELLNAEKPAGIKVKAFAVPGKVALWLSANKGPNFGSVDEDTIALEICNEETGASFHIPACAYVPDWLKDKLNNTNCYFLMELFGRMMK